MYVWQVIFTLHLTLSWRVIFEMWEALGVLHLGGVTSAGIVLATLLFAVQLAFITKHAAPRSSSERPASTTAESALAAPSANFAATFATADLGLQLRYSAGRALQ